MTLSKLSLFAHQAMKQVSNTLSHFANPVVGTQVISMQRASLLARVHGERVEILAEKDGFLPRISPQELARISVERIQKYQEFNEAPFGYGACESMEQLAQFMADCKTHADSGSVYTFYGKSVSMGELKIELGLEASRYDKESEQIIMQHIPFKQFLAATCPKYREKLMGGLLVPNAMHEYNKELPKMMRMSDLQSEKNVLQWLLINDAEQAFNDFARYVYGNATEESLQRRFNSKEDQALLEAIGNVVNPQPKLQF